MQPNAPNNNFRRTALIVSLAVSVLALAALAVYIWSSRGTSGGESRTTADAATEQAIAGTCEEQVRFLLTLFMYEEAIERLGGCPDAADGRELSHLAKETYSLLGIFRNADTIHPIAGLPIVVGWKKSAAESSAEPSVKTDFVSPPVRKLVLYRKARAAYTSGNLPQCLELLGEAGDGPPLEDYRLHLETLAAFYSGNYERVHELAQKFRNDFSESLLFPDITVLEAGALLKEGHDEVALSLLMKAAGDMKTREGKGRALTAAAGIHEADGRIDSVIETLLLIAAEGIEKGEDETYAEPLWDILKDVNWKDSSPEAAVRMGKYLLDAERSYRALTILKRAAKSHPDEGVQLALGEAELATGAASDAKSRFDSITRRANDQNILREACLGSARSLKALNKLNDAAAVYNRCFEKHEDFKYVPLQELAWMYWWADEESKALAVMKKLVEQFPRIEENDAIYRLLGRKEYLDRRYDEALKYYGALADYFPYSEQAQHAYFWMGKIHAERGDEKAALDSFAQIAKWFPYSYYYYRVRGGEQAAHPWEGADRNYQAAVATVNVNLHLKNGYALLAAGMTTDSLREFRAVGIDEDKKSLAAREAALGQALAVRRMENYPASTKILEKKIETDAGWYREVMSSGALRELLFPTLYREEVEAAAREFGAEPAAVFAVIRQESRFERRARSSSNALGLMQIIPSTGSWCAEKMGLRGFKTNLLYEPGLNVRMGTWYLKQMNEKFDSFPLALAAYNWGPGNLSRWIKNHQDADIDRFIESIPRAETRRYVKNCLLNYYVYSSIDSGAKGNF